MTVETKLRSAMADAVAPAAPDTDRLVALARRRGMGIRRRRQALGTVGVAAALGLAVLAPNVIAGDHDTGSSRDDSMYVSSQPRSFDAEPTEPLSGRSAAAALLYAVGLEAHGEASDVRGASTPGGTDPHDRPESYVIFRFTPEGSRSKGEVAINVQPDFLGADLKPGDTAREEMGQCQSYMARCTATRLGDGSQLLTYDDPSTYRSGGIRRVASLYRPDGVRIIVSASNGYDVTERAEKITRSEPVLTTDQLVAIVTQPWWGEKLPAYFTEQGKQLEGYSDRSARATAQTTVPPTSDPMP